MTPYFKLSGGGNDFIALAEPDAEPSADTIRQWCRRGLSIGADGLFALHRRANGIEMRYWNSDGGEADLCINGTRCAARLSFHLGWAEETLTLNTGAGPLRARQVDGTTVGVEAPLPSAARACTLATDEGSFAGWLVRVGTPHFVTCHGEDLAQLPVERLGPQLRSHPTLGSEGANVDFVSFTAGSRVAVRSFERGIEGETLACGTGVLAVVAAGLEAERTELPTAVETRGGFTMRVEGRSEGGRVLEWELIGDARLVAEGRLLPGALI